MKKNLILFMLLAVICKGQMTLENSYTNSSLNSGKKFLLIQIAPSDFKYFIFESAASQFKLYNLNHSLYATVNIPVTFNSSSNNYGVCFVTKSLFDCDSTNLEYAIMNLGDGSPTYPAPYFAIYRSTGLLLQRVDSCRFINYGQGYAYGPYNNANPIINTPAGAKLILNHVNNSIKIYSLCSLIPTSNTEHVFDTNIEALPFPNPSTNKIILPYKLEDAYSGTIIVYNVNGQIIKQIEVDSNFDNLIFENNDLSNGTYFYTLKTKKSETKLKKFIVAR